MSSGPLLRAGLKDLGRRGWQFGLMVLGVSLGVAVVMAIDLANQAAAAGFDLSRQAVVGRATHQIVGGPDGISTAIYAQVRREFPDMPSAPVIEGQAVAGPNRQPVRLLGVDPLADRDFRPLFDQASLTGEAIAPFFRSPDGVLVPQALADAAGLNPGGRLDLEIAGQTRSAIVLGVMQAGGPSTPGIPDDLLILDVASAQELLGMDDRLTRIDLIATPGEASRLQDMLPAGAAVIDVGQQSATAAQLASAFQLNLTALSLLALVVGMFLIYNTVMFSVVQRRTVLATLRALGATPAQVVMMVGIEAAAVGLLGAVIGLGLGWAMAQVAVRLEAQTINDFYFAVSVQRAALQGGSAVKGLLLGPLASLVAAAGPAVEAARVQPVEALRPSALESRVRGWLVPVSLAGAALAGLGTAGLVWVTYPVTASFAAMFAVLFGLALLTPAATVFACRLARPVLTLAAGQLGAMAARTIDRALSRTSVAIAALMVALAVTIGVGLMVDSFRSTVVNWLDLTLPADIYLSAPAAGSTRPTASLPAELAERLKMVPGIQTVETFRGVTVQGGQGPIQLSVADARRERAAGLYRFSSGSPRATWDRVLQGAVIVNEPFAVRHAIDGVGGTVELLTDRGWHTFPVAGVYYDYATDQDGVLMADSVYRQYWNDRSISSMSVFLAPGADVAVVAQAAREAMQGTGLEIQTNRSLREQALGIFDRTFAITAALRLLAIMVAFVGVLSALLALQLERRQELATLVALGLTERGLWMLNLMETGLIGLIAGVCSIPVGLVLAAVLAYVINVRSFGWTIELQVDPWILAQAVLLGVVASLLAGVYPVVRLTRMPPAEGLRRE